MPARAMWKGEICLEDVRVPVKLYAAIEDQSIRFHLLHDQDLVRVRQRMVNPQTNKTVPAEQIQKAYPVSRDELVLLEAEDLDALQPQASREIEVLQVVPHEAVDHPWYDRPYWLGPDEGADGAYFSLARALEKQKTTAIVRWVMRKNEYLGAVSVLKGYLALVTLRHAEELVPTSQLEAPAGRALDKQELKLAAQLISALEGEFDSSEYHDEYRQRVRELIAAKQEGKTVVVEEAKPKPRHKSLAESLQASLQAVG
jgi:DNA end-binding protein Ku